jgi:mRNA-degrading endonuclease toxin of MazEF toxin-antitoxin module
MGLDAGSSVDLRLASGSLVVRPDPGPATLESLLGAVASQPGRQVVVRSYSAWSPGRGDLIRVSSSAAPLRAAFVVSPTLYGKSAERALVCEVAEMANGSRFGVALPGGVPVHGVILADRVGVLDLRPRSSTLICRMPEEVTRKVQERLLALVG